MATHVEIANMVAELIGTDARVTDPDEDRPLARNVKAVWNMARTAALRDGAWNFAIRRDALAASAGDVPYPRSKAYRLPSDALRLLEVLNDEARDDYELEGRLILCDAAAPLYVRCIVDMPEPADWDAAFARAHACFIAATIGKRIAGSAYDVDAGWALYKQAVGASRTVDARENPPGEQEESAWVTARYNRSGIGP